MRQATRAGIWGLWFFLGTSCASIVHEAVQRDIDENNQLPGKESQARELNDEALQACPAGQIQYEDCRVTPCQVRCEVPEEPKRQ